MTDRVSRRRLIALSGAASVSVLAGCSDEGPGEEEGEEPTDDPAGEGDDPAGEEDPAAEEEDPAEEEDAAGAEVNDVAEAEAEDE